MKDLGMYAMDEMRCNNKGKPHDACMTATS